MKTLLGTLALGALLAISSVAIAAGAPDPVTGNWILNTSKSSGTGPMPKSETRTYAPTENGVLLEWTRVGADGKTSNVKTTFGYDGKDYQITGSDDFDALNAKRIDANTIESTQKKAGKVVGTTKRTVSADGKTLTLESKMTTADGKTVNMTMVYDKK